MVRESPGAVIGAVLLGSAGILAQAEGPATPPPEPVRAQPAPPPSETARTFLGYRWEGVERARYEIRVVENVKREGTQGNASETTDTSIELSVSPAGKEEGRTWLAVTLERRRIQAAAHGLDVDSGRRDNPLGGPLSVLPAVYEAIRDKPVRLLVTPGGRVQKVEGVESLVAAAAPLVPEGPQRDQLLALMIPTDVSAAAAQLDNVRLYLPGVSAEAGYARQEKWDVPGVGRLDRKLELLGEEEQEGRRTVRVRQTLSGQDLPPVPLPAQKITLGTRRYENLATVWIDAELAVPVRLETTVQSEQEIRKEGADPSAPPDTVVRSTTTISTKLLELDKADGAEPAGAPAPGGKEPAPEEASPPPTGSP